MKTCNAFALKNFDNERILQQKYFSEFKFGTALTDAEIICAFDTSTILGITATKRQLAKIMARLNNFQTRLTFHNDRLLRYSALLVEKFTPDNADTIQEKIRRARALSDKYADACRAIQNLQRSIYSEIEKIELASELTFLKEFGRRLKVARQAAGLTQTELGNLVQYSQNSISNIEKGLRAPTLSQLARISKTLKRPTDWLLGLSQ